MTQFTDEQLKALVTVEVVHEITGWSYETIMKALLLEKRKEAIKNVKKGTD